MSLILRGVQPFRPKGDQMLPTPVPSVHLGSLLSLQSSWFGAVTVSQRQVGNLIVEMDLVGRSHSFEALLREQEREAQSVS